MSDTMETTGAATGMPVRESVFAEIPDTAKPVSGWWAIPQGVLIWVASAIVGLILAAIAGIAGAALVADSGLTQEELANNPPAEIMVPAVVGFVLGFFGSTILFSVLKVKMEKRSLASAGLGDFLYGAKFWPGLLGGVLLAIVLISPMAIVGDIWDSMPVGEPDWSKVTTNEFYIACAILFVIVMVQAPSEEVMFRGWMFSGLGARHGLMAAVILSSLFFGLAHGDRAFVNPTIGLYYIILTAALGFLFAGVSKATGSVAVAAGLHTGYNLTLMILAAAVITATSEGSLLDAFMQILDVSDIEPPELGLPLLFDMGARTLIPIGLGLWFLNRHRKA
mgnify:CR=1 FL=1